MTSAYTLLSPESGELRAIYEDSWILQLYFPVPVSG